jgi:hypothetical protein
LHVADKTVGVLLHSGRRLQADTVIPSLHRSSAHPWRSTKPPELLALVFGHLQRYTLQRLVSDQRLPALAPARPPFCFFVDFHSEMAILFQTDASCSLEEEPSVPSASHFDSSVRHRIGNGRGVAKSRHIPNMARHIPKVIRSDSKEGMTALGSRIPAQLAGIRVGGTNPPSVKPCGAGRIAGDHNEERMWAYTPSLMDAFVLLDPIEVLQQAAPPAKLGRWSSQ